MSPTKLLLACAAAHTTAPVRGAIPIAVPIHVHGVQPARSEVGIFIASHCANAAQTFAR